MVSATLGALSQHFLFHISPAHNTHHTMLKDVHLVISQQGSLEQEKVYKNGASKNVHAVIKNIPFQFELATSSPSFSFHKAPPVEAKLLYDCAGSEKTVDFVKAAPLEYACKISPKGDSVTVDMKLSVLSSQHEDMFFLVKFSFKGNSTASIISDPIKVVSKPAQLKKNRTGLRRGTKRTFNDTLKESLARIEAAQRDQQAMLGTLFQTIALNQLVPPSQKTPLLAKSATKPPLKKAKTEPLPDPEAEAPSKSELFQKQLRALIQLYHELPQDDRAETVRKSVKGSSTEELEQLSEVVDCLMLEGLKREIGTNVNTGSPYAGLADFGVNMEEPGLGTLDSFCQDFLSPVLFQEGDYTC